MTGDAAASVRPLPKVNDDEAFFWEATAEHKLVAQRCSVCKQLRHPPQPLCPRCGSFEWTVEQLSGLGEIYSYAVVYRPAVPGFEMPIVTVLVALREGPRIVSQLRDADPLNVRIGQPVRVVFLEVAGFTLPEFGLDRGSEKSSTEA